MKNLIGLLLCFVLFITPAAPSFAAKVVIDAGHGGKDSGAIGINGLLEKNVNLDIAFKLKESLINKGYEVVMSRENDRFIELEDRVSFTNHSKADIFVSIHANSMKTSKTQGSLVLYYDSKYPQKRYPASNSMIQLSPKSKQLAQYILTGLVNEIGTVNLGLMASSAHVIRMGIIPSVLVETAFLSNSKDAALLANPDARTRMAFGIAKGIEKFLPAAFADLDKHWAKEYIMQMKEKGIIRGENNRFYPDRPITRAELLTMLDRIIPFGDRLLAANGSKNNSRSNEVTTLAASEITVGVPAASTTLTASKINVGASATASLPAKATTTATATATAISTATATATATATVTATSSATEISSISKPETIKTDDLDKPEPWEDKNLLTAFEDIQPGLWYFDTLSDAYALGYIEGYADGTVKADRPVTRAEAAAIIQRILLNNRTQNVKLPKKPLFQDVPFSLWSAKGIYDLQQIGLIKGVGPGKFAPWQRMTRAEIAVIIDRYFQLNNS